MLGALTTAELVLVQSLLIHFRAQMLSELRANAPKRADLTPAGRAQYERDAALALSALDKLTEEIAA